MKLIKIVGAVLVVSFIFAGIALAEDEDYIVLWGKQTEGWGSKNATLDGNKVTLKAVATIVKVEGDAKGYCIWSRGRAVLCGSSEGESIVGKTLSPGTYIAFPGLEGQKSATVTIYLKY